MQHRGSAIVHLYMKLFLQMGIFNTYIFHL
uniref:Uncharacterized protein n=1 Tax=Anguilla anguilla TaxID=7936 RepID=A0A0E9UKS6_ANGAN